MSIEQQILQTAPARTSLVEVSRASETRPYQRSWPCLQMFLFAAVSLTLLIILLALHASLPGRIVLTLALLVVEFISKAILFGLLVKAIWKIAGRIVGLHGGRQ